MYKLFQDGNSWCAVYGDFINLQEIKAWFGDAPNDAIEDLLKKE